MTKEEWLASLEEGDDGTGFEGDGTHIMCGDHLVPVDDCGCLL
jgi:hypothetical protein